MCIHVNLNMCKEFKVMTPVNLVSKYCNVSNTECEVLSVPDHSVLQLIITVGFTNIVKESISEGQQEPCAYNDLCNNFYSSESLENYYTRYKINTVSEGFLQSDINRQAVLNLIERIETSREQQTEVDSVYNKFCNVYYQEMSRWFQSKNVHPTAKKRLRHNVKPFWNEKLKDLWIKLCESEKLFVSTNDATSNVKRQKF